MSSKSSQKIADQFPPQKSVFFKSIAAEWILWTRWMIYISSSAMLIMRKLMQAENAKGCGLKFIGTIFSYG